MDRLDLVYMGKKRISLLLKSKSGGQSTVEYLFLITVLSVFFITLFKSRFITMFFGEDSKVLERMVASMEYCYRNGNNGFIRTPANISSTYNSGQHPSYLSAGETRFFLVKRYPE